MDRLTARLASRYLSYALPFLYLLTSIAFYLRTYDSAQVKITIVQMAGTALIGYWYVRLACDFQKQWDRYALVAAPLLAALASGILAFTHSAYQGGGLEESLRRVFYVHFALIALREIYTIERVKRMILFLLVAVAVAALYGLLQFVDGTFYHGAPSGVDPFVWRGAFGTKIFSTFGNPNFFGNFLVILTPITLALLIKKNPDRPISVIVFALFTGLVSAFLWHTDEFLAMVRLAEWSTMAYVLLLIGFSFFAVIRFSFLGLLFFLITLCTIVTESKGSWIGYTAGFVAFLMLVLFYFSQFQSDDMRKKLQRVAVALLIFATLGVGIYAHKRITSIRFRVTTWVSTWEMAQWHPVWGNGIGSFRILYPAVRRVQIFHIEGKHNTETDHAENEYWEVLQDEGIIGFGIFIWMLTTFSVLGTRALGRFTEGLSIRDPVTGKRKVSQDPRAYYMLGILAAFWGMLVHNLMDVSLRFVSSGIFLWLLMGLIGAMVVHDPMASTDEQEAAREEEKPASPAHHPLLLLICRFVCWGVFTALTVLVLREFNNAQGPLMGGLGEQLLWLISWVAVFATIAGFWYGMVRIGLSLRHVYGFLIMVVVMAWPIKAFWGFFMADVHHNRGIFFSKQGQWEQAIANYSETVRRNPYYIMAYYFMGNVYTDRWGPGDVDRAMKEYERVWAIAPNYVQTHHQAGLVYLKKGQGGRQAFDTMRAQGKIAEATTLLAQAEADWKQALYYFNKYHAIDPVFEHNYSRWGWVHMQLGDIAQMRGSSAEASAHYARAEELYTESLQAWKCRAPENDVLHENWEANHRHWNAEMFENLGNVRFVRNNLPGAARAYRLSLWKNPDNARALKNLMVVLGRLNRASEMRGIAASLRSMGPQDPEVLRLINAYP